MELTTVLTASPSPPTIENKVSRLIDHRPVVQGEICYFEKRGFRESRFRDNLNKMVVETNEQSLPKCSEHMHKHLCEAVTRLEDGNHMSQRIQQRELEADQSTQLQVTIDRQKEDWDKCVKAQQRLKEEVDEEHTKAVGRLSIMYSDTKKDLAKFSHFRSLSVSVWLSA
uniref:Biogenesis of lysosome-related organelles complex 1 subunit 5 n=1 Tax=Salmo trutta TaxID=8032 RepID=A0A673XWB2_SALTR